MAKRTVAILGASADRSKFGNKSVRAHAQAGYEVYPVNPKGGQIEGLPAYRSLAEVPVARPNRISVYLPPAVGLAALAEIAAKGCDELWFNPGSETPQLIAAARKLKLNAIAACSIVDLGLSPAQFP
ncbi:MAG TPA: CoA-binding protein [Pirellulales bacterium]|jgi:predicted CoA-binding protein|nr:CoA-binding protein [Pirellulales bacterium]